MGKDELESYMKHEVQCIYKWYAFWRDCNNGPKNISRYYSRKLSRNEDLSLQIEGEQHVLKNIQMINRKTCPSRTTYLQRNNPLIFSEKQKKSQVICNGKYIYQLFIGFNSHTQW